jgi:hypothetical protein
MDLDRYEKNVLDMNHRMENKQVKHLVQHINVLLNNDQQWLNNLNLNQKTQYIY